MPKSSRQLKTGDAMSTAKPFRQADFVLYSISNPPENERDDTDTLPFGELWGQVKKEAASPIEDPNYKNAKVLMVNLYQDIISSPDLTDAQADALAKTFKNRMVDIHGTAVSFGALGGEEETPEMLRQATARQDALDILDL